MAYNCATGIRLTHIYVYDTGNCVLQENKREGICRGENSVAIFTDYAVSIGGEAIFKLSSG